MSNFIKGFFAGVGTCAGVFIVILSILLILFRKRKLPSFCLACCSNAGDKEEGKVIKNLGEDGSVSRSGKNASKTIHNSARLTVRPENATPDDGISHHSEIVYEENNEYESGPLVQIDKSSTKVETRKSLRNSVQSENIYEGENAINEDAFPVDDYMEVGETIKLSTTLRASSVNQYTEPKRETAAVQLDWDPDRTKQIPLPAEALVSQENEDSDQEVYSYVTDRKPKVSVTESTYTYVPAAACDVISEQPTDEPLTVTEEKDDNFPETLETAREQNHECGHTNPESSELQKKPGANQKKLDPFNRELTIIPENGAVENDQENKCDAVSSKTTPQTEIDTEEIHIAPPKEDPEITSKCREQFEPKPELKQENNCTDNSLVRLQDQEGKNTSEIALDKGCSENTIEPLESELHENQEEEAINLNVDSYHPSTQSRSESEKICDFKADLKNNEHNFGTEIQPDSSCQTGTEFISLANCQSTFQNENESCAENLVYQMTNHNTSKNISALPNKNHSDRANIESHTDEQNAITTEFGNQNTERASENSESESRTDSEVECGNQTEFDNLIYGNVSDLKMVDVQKE